MITDMEDDGKVGGKIPILDDILAFMWCKMNTCPCETLLNVVKTFYKVADVVKARDTYFRRLPDTSGRRVKHRKAEDILKGLYDLMQSIPTEDPPVFLALNLNNLPFIELKNVDGAALVSQQRVMKNGLDAVLTEQEEMRKQLLEIRSLLTDATAPATAQPPADGVPREDSSNNVSVRNESYANVISSGVARAPSSQRGSRSTRGRAVAGSSGVSSSAGLGRSRPRARNPGSGSADQADPRRTNSPGGTVDDEGFTVVSNRRARRRQRSVILGRNTATNIRSVPQVKKVRVFVSRLEANLTPNVLEDFVKNLISDDCSVMRLKTKFPSYSSYLVSCDFRHKDTVMNPDEWGEGILIRPFFGKPLAYASSDIDDTEHPNGDDE